MDGGLRDQDVYASGANAMTRSVTLMRAGGSAAATRRAPLRALGAMLAGSLFLAACGSQRTTEEIAAAAGGAANGAGSGNVVGEGSVTSGGGGSASGPAPGDPAAVQPGDAGEVAVPGASGTEAQGGTQTTSGGDASGAAAVPGAAGKAASGSPIRIGVVGTTSGVGGTQIGTVKGIQIWAKTVNARGGVAGHPVEVVAVDDGGDPARLRANVQKLVEQQKVIAFVGAVTVFTLTQGVVEYLEKKRVPFVGGDRLNAAWLQSPMLFPQANADENILVRDITTIARTGRKKIAFVTCAELQLCKDASNGYPPIAEKMGLQVVYKAEAPFSQPDFTAECVAARNAGADVFILASDANSSRRIAASCARQNYRPQFTLVQTAGEMTRDPALVGAVFPSDTVPWVAGDTPAAKEFQDAVAKFAPAQQLSQHWTSGWVAAKLFEKAAAKLGPEPTSEQVLQGLWAIKNDTLGGLTAPLTFNKDKPAKPVMCYFQMKIEAGKWTAPQGSRSPVCTSV